MDSFQLWFLCKRKLRIYAAETPKKVVKIEQFICLESTIVNKYWVYPSLNGGSLYLKLRLQF